MNGPIPANSSITFNCLEELFIILSISETFISSDFVQINFIPSYPIYLTLVKGSFTYLGLTLRNTADCCVSTENENFLLLSKSRPKGRGGGQVVSVLAFYSDDPSSNPAEVCNFSV